MAKTCLLVISNQSAFLLAGRFLSLSFLFPTGEKKLVLSTDSCYERLAMESAQ